MHRHHHAFTLLFGFLAGVVSLGALECLARGGAAVAQDSEAAPKIDKEKLQKEISEINIQYARDFLRIAQLGLEKAQAYNETVSGSFSQAEMDRLQRLEQVAKARLSWAEKHGNQADANLLSAELAVQAAETTYRKSLATIERLPSAINPITLEQQRLALDLARLSLKKARLITGAGSDTAGLQWQVDQLRDEVLNLRAQLESITSRR